METAITPTLVIMLLIAVLNLAWSVESSRIDIRLAEFCSWQGDVYDAASCRAVVKHDDGTKEEWVRFVLPEGKHAKVSIRHDTIYSRDKIHQKVFTMVRPYEGGPGVILDEKDEDLWEITPA